ncbi:recombinase family protein [Gordonia hongkongensis]|jgi:site-specific DNA recombinase|uniref:recombinase family protein n=1 Tax=Gordonia TaxID=2053 RepID=UPI001CF9AF28|nr:recombinase family protein [Gordonia sp. WA4-43]UCZ90282.1 recombinase family protein [Gordonia sp. WA4-43]
MTIAAVYLRVSKSDEQDDESLTIETQRRRIAALCEARGWTYGPEYLDEGVSATKSRGTSTRWSEMLSHVGTGRFDVIVARDLDRLLRTLQDLVKLIDLGAKVATVDGEIDLTTADGEFRATMLAAVARFEIRRKSERSVHANETRRRRGLPIVRAKILGYDDDGVTQIDDEAAAVRGAFEDFVMGKRITHVARDLAAAGFTTSRNREWSNENIRALLRNAKYKGVLTKWGSDEEYSGDFEAIVPVDLWEAAQAKLDDPDRKRAWGTQPQYLLSGIALCGKCDDGKTKLYTSYYQRSPYTGKDGMYREFEPRRIYKCLTHQHLSRGAEDVEQFVEAVVIGRLSAQDAREALAPRDDGLDRDALRFERRTLQTRFDGLAALAADGVLPLDQVREQSARLRSRLAEIDGVLAPSTLSPVTAMLDADDVAMAWSAMDIAQRRAIVQALLTVTILPAKRGAKGFDPALVCVAWRS